MDKKITIVTHSSSFHTDDIFAVATLLIALGEDKNIEIIRSREKEVQKIKEDFTSMIVHELRSPLDSIKKMIEMMRSSKVAKARQAECLQMIYGSSSEMLELVNNLLDMAKIEAGKFELAKKDKANILNAKKWASSIMDVPKEYRSHNTYSFEYILNDLSEKERQIIIMRNGLDGGTPHTLEEVGQHFQVTRERIRQIESKVHEKIRNHPKIGQLRNYVD